MTKQPILAAAAAAVTFGVVADAAAAPITYDVVFSPTVGSSSGTGFFTIDSSLLTPNDDITDVNDIDAFGASFVGLPPMGTGSASFDLDDLNGIWLKTNGSGEIYSASFGTVDSGDPDLDVSIFGFSTLDYGFIEISYYASVTRRTTTAVPEPGTLALLAAGAAGLPLLRRRRTERKAA
jgi:hypothetical protein